VKKLSIVTINLNMKDGLGKSIKSLIAQDQKENIEYIVVDGLSSDGSQEIIEQYKDYIDKVVIEKDTGIFDAMNKGIKLATGEYIYFLNSGDEFASDDVLYFVLNEIYKKDNNYNIYSGDVATYRFGRYIGISDLYPWIVHQSAFVKTRLMKDYMFDSELKIFGDLDFWTRLSNDKQYKHHKINKIIANMEIDGIGSHPKDTFKRLKDKKYYTKKHNMYSNYIASCFSEVLGFIIYKFFGEKFYYHTFSKLMQNTKKILKRPFWAIRKVIYKIYSILTYPIYKISLKRYKFGSFIHPLSSIGNHNMLSIGKNTEINHNVTIWGDNIFIGNNSQINPNSVIYGNVQIGHDVMVAPNCMIAGANHSYTDINISMRFQGGNSKGIIIEDDVWIGANSVILDGITIRQGSIIGAGSVVTQDIDKYCIAIGNPCKIIKKRGEYNE